MIDVRERLASPLSTKGIEDRVELIDDELTEEDEEEIDDSSQNRNTEEERCETSHLKELKRERKLRRKKLRKRIKSGFLKACRKSWKYLRYSLMIYSSMSGGLVPSGGTVSRDISEIVASRKHRRDTYV